MKMNVIVENENGRDCFSGCYALFCYCCFLGSLADKIDESYVSACCVPNVLAVYRMKIRSILKIRVKFINYIESLFDFMYY